MKLSPYEQETIINFNEAEKAASVYTHNNALRHKLEKSFILPKLFSPLAAMSKQKINNQKGKPSASPHL